MCLDFLGKHKDKGLLFLRVGLGAMFMLHGWGKLTAGPEVWTRLGGAMGYLGINFAPQFFGFMASITEFGGGLCLALGIFFRPACLMLSFVMLVASTMHLASGDGIKVASHAIEAGVVFFGLMFIGPGEYTLGKKLCRLFKK